MIKKIFYSIIFAGILENINCNGMEATLISIKKEPSTEFLLYLYEDILTQSSTYPQEKKAILKQHILELNTSLLEIHVNILYNLVQSLSTSDFCYIDSILEKTRNLHIKILKKLSIPNKNKLINAYSNLPYNADKRFCSIIKATDLTKAKEDSEFREELVLDILEKILKLKIT